MSRLSLTRQHLTPTIIGILATIFIIIMAAVLFLSYLFASRTREQIESQQNVQTEAPTTPIKRQIHHITLEKLTETGELVRYEIGLDGSITIYDEQGNIIKTGLQGIGRISRLFSDIDRYFTQCNQNPPFIPNAYKVTIITSLGTCVIYIPIADSRGGSDIISGIDDIVDDTFAPTPTLAPTNTPYPGYISPTPTNTPSNPPYTPGPTTFSTGPTPSPLPGYLTDPPFKCSDYHASRPFAISNVICGLNE